MVFSHSVKKQAFRLRHPQKMPSDGSLKTSCYDEDVYYENGDDDGDDVYDDADHDDDDENGMVKEIFRDVFWGAFSEDLQDNFFREVFEATPRQLKRRTH